MDTRQLTRDKTIGDAAVDGLLSGVLAGAIMVVYLIGVGLVTGEGPGTVLARFSAAENTSPLFGAFQHLAVSGIYGALFGIGWRIVARRWWWAPSIGKIVLAGLGYGLALWLVAHFAILPATGSPLGDIPPIHFLLAHALYGATLGLVLNRLVRPSS